MNKVFIGGIGAVKAKKPKYKIGQMVYSYQNRNKKARINFIRISEDSQFDHKYRLTLPGEDGYNKNSNWINESSLYLTKRK